MLVTRAGLLTWGLWTGILKALSNFRIQRSRRSRVRVIIPVPSRRPVDAWRSALTRRCDATQMLMERGDGTLAYDRAQLALIARKIRTIVDDPSFNPPFLRSCVIELGVLPLYLDWTHCLAMRPDGVLSGWRAGSSLITCG